MLPFAVRRPWRTEPIHRLGSAATAWARHDAGHLALVALIGGLWLFWGEPSQPPTYAGARRVTAFTHRKMQAALQAGEQAPYAIDSINFVPASAIKTVYARRTASLPVRGWQLDTGAPWFRRRPLEIVLLGPTQAYRFSAAGVFRPDVAETLHVPQTHAGFDVHLRMASVHVGAYDLVLRRGRRVYATGLRVDVGQ